MDEVKNMIAKWLKHRSEKELAEMAKIFKAQKVRDENVRNARRKAGWLNP